MYLGDQLKVLHDEEFDFGKADAQVAGAVFHGTGRNVTWNLMTAKPLQTSCQEDSHCHISLTTSSGYVQFSRDIINMNTVYYICCNAEEVNVERGTVTEILPALNFCSNGFVLDDIPPYGGEVYINNVNGYIKDLDDLVITWQGFTDNIDVQTQGYVSNIKSYSVEIGKLFICDS